MGGVLPIIRHGSGVEDLIYIARNGDPLAGGPGLRVTRVNETLVATDSVRLT